MSVNQYKNGKLVRIAGNYNSSDLSEGYVEFNSQDTERPAKWTDVSLVESGEKQKSLWEKATVFFKNVRYLWKLIGITDISAIGNGTVTGALSELNSNLSELNTRLSNVRNYTIYYDRQDFSLKTLLNTLNYELQKLTVTTAFTATLQSGVVYGVYGYYTPDTGSGACGAMNIIQYGKDVCHTWYASLYGGGIKISDKITTPTSNSTIA